MRIIYEIEKTTSEKIIEAVHEAIRLNKKIEKILLNPREFYSVEAEVLGNMIMRQPLSEINRNVNKFQYYGVSIEREP